MTKKYYTVYKTTNLLNGKIYVGTHKTSNPNDDYLGSGKHLKYAIEKYGKENFKKEVLAIFDNPEQMFEMESQIVNEEFVNSKDTYNLKIGGYGGFDYMVKVRGKRGHYTDGKTIKLLYKDDSRVLSGEWVSMNKGKVLCRDETGSCFSLPKESEEYKSGKFCGVMKGKVVVKTPEGEIITVETRDRRYISGELKHINKGIKRSGLVRNKGTSGKIWVNNGINEIYISQDGVIPKGFKKGRLGWSSERKENIKGERNPNYGARWLCNDKLKLCKFIKAGEVELYIQNGWVKGFNPLYCGKREGIKRNYNSCRTTKDYIWIYKGSIRKLIQPALLNEFLEKGWSKGFKLKEVEDENRSFNR